MNTLIPSVQLLILLVVLGLWWRERARKRQQFAQETIQETVGLCDALVQLLGHLQQHRGMSSAWLAGDAAFAARLTEKQSHIQLMTSLLSEAARREVDTACPCFTHQDWSLFLHQWKTLLADLPSLSIDQSMGRHTQLVTKVLEWLAAIGEARIAPLGKHSPLQGVARNFTYRLPQLAECLGQARAIGASVAARHGCPPVARVRLQFLMSRAETLLAQALAAHEAGHDGRQSQAAIAAMSAAVRDQLLLRAGVAMSSTEYFALATQAIDRVFDWVGLCARETRQFAVAEPSFAWPAHS